MALGMFGRNREQVIFFSVEKIAMEGFLVEYKDCASHLISQYIEL